MQLVNLSAIIGEVAGVIDPTPYVEALAEIGPALPAGARAFATDPSHYDFGGRRCTKDLWLQALAFGRYASDPDADDDGDWIEISFRHNCFKHDENLSVRYATVERVSLDLRTDTGRWRHWTDEDQVILDEILPAPEGCSHEIAFHGGGRIAIVCRDLVATWTRADCPELA